MSDDKKRDRALQRRVRERQAKTGESYQAAWRQLTDSDEPALSRVATRLPPLDLVLGGGLVTASVVLLAGSPGTGKTVLTLQMLKGCEHPCLYVTTEETREQVAATAKRIGAVADWIYVSAERSLAKILEQAREVGAQTIAIDTIQKIACEDNATGALLQVRTCVDRLVTYAKTTGTTLWLVGHVTSDGAVAYPKTTEHSVDVVLKLNRGERFGGAERYLRSDKNRFGRSEVTAHFEFTVEGFIPVDNDGPEALRASDAPSAGAQSPTSSRLIIPLHLDRVPPRQPTRVAARASNGAVDIERLFLSAAGTPGGTADWIVNDVEIDGQSQLAHKDLPGALFGGHGSGAVGRATTTLAFQGFDPVERDHELALIVTYVGPNPEGIPFFATAVGTKPAQRPTVVPITSKVPLAPLMKTTLRARVQNATFQIARIEIIHPWRHVRNARDRQLHRDRSL